MFTWSTAVSSLLLRFGEYLKKIPSTKVREQEKINLTKICGRRQNPFFEIYYFFRYIAPIIRRPREGVRTPLRPTADSATATASVNKVIWFAEGFEIKYDVGDPLTYYSCFVDIGGIVDHHCLKLSLHTEWRFDGPLQNIWHFCGDQTSKMVATAQCLIQNLWGEGINSFQLSWRQSVEEMGENHRPVANHWHTLSHDLTVMTIHCNSRKLLICTLTSL